MLQLKNIFKSQKGSTLVGSLFIMVGLTFFASSAIYVTNQENSATVNEMQATQALQTGSAGLEYASKQLESGLDPSLSDKEFGSGSFTISTEPTSHTVTVTSQVGDAKKIQSITTDNFSNNCVDFDSSLTPYTDGKEIYNVALVKTCNEAAYITSITMSWDWTPCVLNEENGDEECNDEDDDAQVNFIGIEGTTIYNPGSVGSPSGGASSGQTMDVEDYALTSNGTYEFSGSPHGIRFDEEHPGGGTYTITVTFADGSSTSTTFTDTQDETTLENTVDFSEEDGTLTVYSYKHVTVEVLGTTLTYGEGGAEISTFLELGYDDGTGQPSYMDLFDGADMDGGESYEEETTETTNYVMRAEADYNSGRYHFHALYDSTDTVNVKTLVNGEPSGIEDLSLVASYLAGYIDADGNMVLADNQIMMLFELGVDVSDNPDSSAVDFEDLVVLFTINEVDVPEAYASYADSENEDHFLVCHVPPSAPENAHTVSLSMSGWMNGHNGGNGDHTEDYLGECVTATSGSTSSTDSSSTSDSPTSSDSSSDSLYYWWYGSSSQKDL